MKKFFALTVLLAILSVLFSGTGANVPAQAAAQERLVIYNWADYIDEGDPENGVPGMLELFRQYYQQTTGVTLDIEYNTFETNEELVTKALLSDAGIDIMCPSDYAIEKLVKNGALKKINFDMVPGYANIDKEVFSMIENTFSEVEGKDGAVYDMAEYLVPYMWGTLGILYNTDIVTEEDLAQGYGLLWNKANNPSLHKKILMKDSVRDSYVAAVLYAKEQGRLPEYYDSMAIAQLINTIDEELLRIVEQVLVEQSRVLYGYEVDFGKDDLIQGNAYVDLAWSGDAIYAIGEGEANGVSLDYFVPEIGGNVWFDGWVIPNGCKNERAALMFIEFMCNPVNAVKNMMYIGYTSAVDKEIIRADEEACAILIENDYEPEEFFESPTQYPEITENLGIMRDFGDLADEAIMMWESIKPSKTNELLLILLVLVGVMGLAAGGYILYTHLKGRKKRIS
jgi:spermidine/putrescine transport system substrate-binding protein